MFMMGIGIYMKKKNVGGFLVGGRLVLEDESGKEIREPRTEGELVYYGANVSMGYAEGWKDSPG